LKVAACAGLVALSLLTACGSDAKSVPDTTVAVAETTTPVTSAPPATFTGDAGAVLGGGGPLALLGGVASWTGGTALSIDRPGRRYRLQFQASGLAPLRLGDLFKDSDLMKLARNHAFLIFERDPKLELPENAGCRTLLAENRRATLSQVS
jgi:hypothetical protein